MINRKITYQILFDEFVHVFPKIHNKALHQTLPLKIHLKALDVSTNTHNAKLFFSILKLD